MEYKTYAQLKTILNGQADLEQEVFIQAPELLEYFNTAINRAEALILNLGVEDEYFLNSANLALSTGVAAVTAMPSDIYGNKIRSIIYSNGGKIFEIKRMRKRAKFLEKAELDYENETDPRYQYILKNASATAGVSLHLVPPSKETSTTNVTMWYIRNANKLALDADKCDIPEFYSFVLAYVRYRVLDKEGMPGAVEAKMELDAEEKLMIQTLENMVPDEDDEVEADDSIYGEMS